MFTSTDNQIECTLKQRASYTARQILQQRGDAIYYGPCTYYMDAQKRILGHTSSLGAVLYCKPQKVVEDVTNKMHIKVLTPHTALLI